MKKQLRIIIGICIAICIGVALFVFPSLNSLRPLEMDISKASAREIMLEHIRAKGSAAAYAEVKEVYSKELPDKRHNAAHVFGEVLYENDGLTGLSICDDTSNFGCYHGFLSVVLRNEGIEILPALKQECAALAKAASRCEHGLGHGVLEYVGHTGLQKALDICLTEVPEQNPYINCFSGVIMEYNLPGRADVRPVADVNRPYDPCDRLDSVFLTTCYHEIPGWWRHLYEQDFEKIGKLCEAIGNERYTYDCYAGVGKVIPPSVHYDADSIIRECARLPNAPAKDLCVSVAAASVLPFYEGSLTKKLCSSLSREEQKRCPESATSTPALLM